MEKNNQPLIITAMIIGAVLIISLAFIFTRDDAETPEASNTGGTIGTGEIGNNDDENGDDQQPQPTPDPAPTPQPDPQPQPPSDPIPAPDPQSGNLPSNWDQLTSQQKTDLNPFDCDHDTQWVSAEDGTCLEKPELVSGPEVPEPELITDTVVLESFNYTIFDQGRSQYCGLVSDEVIEAGNGRYSNPEKPLNYCPEGAITEVLDIVAKKDGLSLSDSQIEAFASLFIERHFEENPEVVEILVSLWDSHTGDSGHQFRAVELEYREGYDGLAYWLE